MTRPLVESLAALGIEGDWCIYAEAFRPTAGAMLTTAGEVQMIAADRVAEGDPDPDVLRLACLWPDRADETAAHLAVLADQCGCSRARARLACRCIEVSSILADWNTMDPVQAVSNAVGLWATSDHPEPSPPLVREWRAGSRAGRRVFEDRGAGELRIQLVRWREEALVQFRRDSGSAESTD